MQIKFYNSENQVPMEMHKVRVVQKLHLLPVEERLAKIKEAGNNTFLLQNRDVFMDMLTDSGVNAMSDNQVAAMGIADDSYAGSETCNRLIDAIEEVFGVRHFLPAHQGRACENILAETFVKPGQFVLMNFHFTTTKAHITRMGGSVIELVGAEGLVTDSQHPFKGNVDIERTKQIIKELGAKNIAFVRIEAGTNLIGGQPVSLENMLEVSKICKENGIMSILDASLLQDNLYFMKTREEMCKNMSIKDIMHKLASVMDIVYFSARKLGFARGGAIISHNEDYILRMKEYIPLYERFLTYGGMEVRSMEAMAVGLRETLDMEYISQGPLFIEYMIKELDKAGVPVVKPAGGLGAHINAREILPHIPQSQYPAAALATALYIAGGVRGMERGTLSEQRNPDGTERFADME
ncbi:MAG: tryptophanase, partial [Bacteroidaceae bacterium]|nr:tryptophanase [Bacteroidaceae bacterium]